jgi:alanine racemase
MSSAETIAPADPPHAERVTTAGPPEAEAGGTLTIDLSAIVANWRALARRAMPAECAAVIKADGYGCGVEPVAAILARAGCRTFFVADLFEARRVRAVAPEPAIYVLNGLMPGTAATFAELHARPVIGSLVELAEWDAFVSANNWTGGCALHVDTGMNRLGISAGEATAVAPRIRSENHGVALLMSHLACAQIPDHPLNDKQIKLFREVRILYRGIPASIANSSGVFLGDAAHCDMVRPGAALFGVNPTPGRNNPMRPVVELRGRIVSVHSVQRGETVGYDATWTAKRAARIAIVAVGYADGYLRAASASDQARGAEAIIAGKRCPLAGRVSMDLLAVDITDLPDNAARRGGMATLIGDEITVDEFAAQAGTIGYEVLTSLGRRYHRVYRVSCRWRAAAPVTFVRTAAPRSAAGRASAKPAASGIPWSRKARAQARAVPAANPARAGCSRSSRSPARRAKRRGSPPAVRSSIASPAAVSCAARCC